MTSELDERQLRLALQTAPVPVLAHDDGGRIRFLNDEFLRITGYTREQLPTLKSWLDLAYNETELVPRPNEGRVGGNGGALKQLPHGGEYRVRIADGSTRIWIFRAYSIGRDAEGAAINVSMARDVTEEYASREALARSEAKLRQALRIGGAGEFERDFIARTVDYSDDLAALHGLPAGERRETFEQWFARIHPADRGRVVAYVEALDDANSPTVIEYCIARARDGAWRWIDERREVHRDDGGRAIGCIGLQRDVTDARGAEQALRLSEARLRLTLEVGHVATFDWNLESNELAWDDRLREIWGLAPDAPISIEEFYRGLHPADVGRVEAVIARSHEPASGGVYEVEYRVVDARDARVRHVAARGRTLFDGNRPVRMLGVAQDVTALREAAAVLERDRAELERLVEARTSELAEAQTRLAHAQRMEALAQLAGGIAHDFNNVLQAVEAAADLIERRPEAEHLPRYIKMAREATKRGSAISRRLSSLSKRSELEPERVDTARLVEDLAGILRRTVGLGVTVATDCAPNCPPLLADRRQLETALLNLATNAREAMSGSGSLLLMARPDTPALAEASPYRAQLRPGDYVRLEVVDTGRGMEADVRARAAEPFFSTKPRGQGAGLGLAMARGFADHSGGALRIDSEPGKGARVAIWLPVAEVASAAAPAPSLAAPGRGRLLLVDDDPLVRELVGEQLRCAGFSVTSCDAGRAAIDSLDSGLSVDLLLTDFSMPEMNGVTLAREARKRMPRLPVVVLTGYASEAADAAGDADFALLSKPIDSKALISRVAELIGAD